MLYQPSNISPDQINGTGTVDVNNGLSVSWRVSGDSAMTAYQIDFYQNDTASTLVYSTGKTTLTAPFWGVNYAGETQYYTAVIPASALTGAGMSNGNTYKFSITQWWTAEDSVQQYTASVFITRATPTLTMTAIEDPVESKSYSFTASFSQAQGDSVKWVRWQISEKGAEANPFYDTGPIYGTGELQCDYDGFLTDTIYTIQCTVESSNGVTVTTGWVDFPVSYALGETSGTASACMLVGIPCAWIQWDQMIVADGYSVMRQTAGESRLVKIADVESTSGQIRDYSAKSGETYTYYIFPTGALEYLTEPMVTNQVTAQYWFWSIVEAEPLDDTGKNYSAVNAYIFRYNASDGGFSNNNSPQITANFTPYPTWQGTTANYLSGSVSGYIGTVSQDRSTYSDTVEQSEALYALSTTKNALFLTDPKGHFLRIRISSAVSVSVDHKKKEMPQTATLSWVETGNTEGIHVIMYPGGDYYPVDRVIQSSISIDPETGKLVWTVPDNYSGTGSALSLNGNGQLVQAKAGSYKAAIMAMDQTTGVVTASVGE